MDRQRLIGAVKYALISIVSIGLIFYIGYHIINNFSGSVQTVVASEVTLYETVEYDAYIMRSEKVLYSLSPGELDGLVGDGVKVRSGEAVAGVYTSESASLREQIAEIDARLELLSSAAGYGTSSLDTGKLDSLIEKALTEMKFQTERGDLAFAAESRAEIVSLIGRRQVITDSSRDIDADIEGLKASRASLVSRLSGALSTVYAPVSGYYYENTDGYENIFSASLKDTVTVENFESMCASVADTSLFGAGVAGKLVTDYIWYAAICADASLLRDLSVGDKYPVSFKYNSDETVEMTLYRVCESADNTRALLIMECDEMPHDFKYTRVQPATLALRSYTGCRLPLGALRVVDGYEGVYILSGKTVHFRRVKVLLETEGYALLTGLEGEDGTVPVNDRNGDGKLDSYDLYPWLEPNDLVVSGGKNLYEGRIVENN